MTSVWSKLNIAQAIVLSVFLVSCAAVAILAPPVIWQYIDWRMVVAAIIALTGGSAGAVLGPILHRDPVRGPDAGVVTAEVPVARVPQAKDGE